MTDFIEVRTTTSEREDAEAISDQLVQNGLAACAQVIGPVSSSFMWKGKMEKVEEYLVLIKTRKELFPDVRVSIEEMHPYEVPEIISIPISGSSDPYLEWMEENTS